MSLSSIILLFIICIHEFYEFQAYQLAMNPNEFHVLLPKVELHAHLHGSIRPATMIDLARRHHDRIHDEDSYNRYNSIRNMLEGSRDLKKCFQIFSILHELVSSKKVLERIAREVLEDYMKDNVIYVELRTTPRSLPDGTSMMEYMETLIDLVAEHNRHNGHRMIVKLLVSIDRSKDINIAYDTLRMLEHFETRNYHRDIVGIDFSGNPSKRSFADFSSIFTQARSRGLCVTIHAGELPADKCEDSQELESILSFQ